MSQTQNNEKAVRPGLYLSVIHYMSREAAYEKVSYSNFLPKSIISDCHIKTGTSDSKYIHQTEASFERPIFQNTNYLDFALLNPKMTLKIPSTCPQKDGP